MTDTLLCEHTETIDYYIDRYYNESKLQDHSFFEPVGVPGTKMTLHMWSVFAMVPLSAKTPKLEILRRIYSFSVYENGSIIDPSIDIRFKEAYDATFDRKPWTECYFPTMKAASSFLRQCNFIE